MDYTLFESLHQKHGLTYQQSYDEILKVVKSVAEYNGLLFGGTVRSLYIPYLLFKDPIPLENLHTNNLDFWFTNQENANKFIEMLNIYKDRYHSSGKNGYFRYPMSKKNYILEYKNNPFLSCVIL